MECKNIILALIVTGLTLALVFFLGERTVLANIQLTLAIISSSLFVFLAIGLYSGIRIKNSPLIDGKWNPLSADDVGASYVNIPLPKLGGDIAETIISFVLWVVVTVLLILLLTVLANIVWILIFSLAFIIYWIFYRALRQVFIKSRKCKGNLALSIGYSLLYTLTYTGWIYGLAYISRFLS